uniref:PH domain-containing protein n=1 Tax=Sus scrofa TaxID=9823 RepID=A0A8D1FCC2_PIG
MSLKLPRNWDFSLRGEAGKIARSRSVMTGEQMAAFHPASSPNPLERPIKMGWLKKQRSIVKNWQQRYFVLRAQQLYYYKDEEDVKPQVPTLADSWLSRAVSSRVGEVDGGGDLCKLAGGFLLCQDTIYLKGLLSPFLIIF